MCYALLSDVTHCLAFLTVASLGCFAQDKEPKGIIPLENVQVREIIHPHRPNCFEIHSNGNDFIKACKTDSDGKVVEGRVTFDLILIYFCNIGRNCELTLLIFRNIRENFDPTLFTFVALNF